MQWSCFWLLIPTGGFWCLCSKRQKEHQTEHRKSVLCAVCSFLGGELHPFLSCPLPGPQGKLGDSGLRSKVTNFSPHSNSQGPRGGPFNDPGHSRVTCLWRKAGRAWSASQPELSQSQEWPSWLHYPLPQPLVRGRTPCFWYGTNDSDCSRARTQNPFYPGSPSQSHSFPDCIEMSPSPLPDILGRLGPTFWISFLFYVAPATWF